MEPPPIATLAQRLRGGKLQELELTEEELRIRTRTLTCDARRAIPVEAIDRYETEARTFPAWSRVPIALGLGTAVVGVLWALKFSALLWPATAPVGLWVAVLAAGVAFGAIALRYALAAESLFFYNTFTGELIIVLHRERPDAAVVNAFVAKMKDLARLRYDELRADAERPSIGRELIALNELREKKVINDEEFAMKKGELLDDMMRD